MNHSRFAICDCDREASIWPLKGMAWDGHMASEIQRPQNHSTKQACIRVLAFFCAPPWRCCRSWCRDNSATWPNGEENCILVQRQRHGSLTTPRISVMWIMCTNSDSWSQVTAWKSVYTIFENRAAGTNLLYRLNTWLIIALVHSGKLFSLEDMNGISRWQTKLLIWPNKMDSTCAVTI
jgi:hypothetical protein